VPVTTLAEALPYVAWVILAALALGTFVFAVATGELTDATAGYLRFTAALAAVFALLALATDMSLPNPTVLAIRPAPPDLESILRIGMVGIALAAVAYAVVVRNDALRRITALVGVAFIVLTMLAAAFGWAPTAVDAVPLAVQFSILMLVTGGSTAAVVLGHWYLVTPRISIRPLVLQTRLLMAVLVLQGLLFVVWTTLGGGVGQGAWDAFTGPSALLVYLRGLITIAFPIVLAYMAWRTALTRSMESATGLLYINLAAVLAGTIGAAALYVSSGLLL
jgi:hypothetical protein